MTRQPSQNRAPSGPGAILTWTVFVALLVGACWGKAQENQRDTKARAAWQKRMTTLQAVSRAEFVRLREWLRSSGSQPRTRQAVEAKLNNGRPFTTTREGDRDEVRWTHPQYGFRVHLSFQDDNLRGFGISGGSPASLPQNLKPAALRFDSRNEKIRQRARSLAIFVWMAGLLLVCLRKHAWLAAQMMLAAALVYGGATVVSPAYSLTPRGILSNDPMFWAIGMYVSALAACGYLCPTDEVKLQFRLRHLLFAMTVCAILVALGPLGYFALGVFVSGGLLFWAIVYLRREPPETCIPTG